MATNKHATGIDVSHYKKRIDWKKVGESGVQFAIIKATEADAFVDPRFDYNWTRTRRQGIIRGAYHFFRPLVDPVKQANNFIKIAGRTLHRTDLPPVLDIESYPDFIGREWKQISLNERLRRIQIWLQTVETATGRIPIIYTEYYSWRDFIGNTEKFVRNPLWIANYRVEQPKVPANNWGGRGWTLWQTTEKGIVPGIRDEAPCVDLDVFRGSMEDLKTWLKIDEPRAPAPEVTNGDMMAALVDAADQMGISSDDFVNRARLRYLVDPIGNSLRPYDGPAVQDLSISDVEKRTLSEVLEKFLGENSSAWSITHQDLINAFYQAATNGTGGWTLVERAGLNYIGEDRAAIYSGPVIEKLPGLTQAQKDIISAALGLGIRLEPEPVEGVVEVDEVEEVEDPIDEVEEQTDPVEETEAEEVVESVPAAPVQSPPAEEVVETKPPQNGQYQTSSATYGTQVDNQAMINAFYLAAIKLDQNGREMMAAAGLAHLVNVRMNVYAGPRLEVLPGLTRKQRETIAELLGIHLDANLMVEDPIVEEQAPLPVEVEPLPVEQPVLPVEEEVTEVAETEGDRFDSIGEDDGVDEVEETEEPVPVPTTNPVYDPTYPGLVNQDLINLFYKVASFFGENGWHWIVRCGLAAIGATRKTRFEDYRGPQIKSIPGLTQDQRDQLERELNQLKFA